MLSDTGLGVVFSACSPFGGIPRNWKLHLMRSYAAPGAQTVPPSGGSLEIGNTSKNANTLARRVSRSPFGGIPRNWKPVV